MVNYKVFSLSGVYTNNFYKNGELISEEEFLK